MENGANVKEERGSAMPIKENHKLSPVNGDVYDKLKVGGLSGSRPSTPKTSSRPGTPKTSSRPGTPKISSRPSTPKTSPKKTPREEPPKEDHGCRFIKAKSTPNFKSVTDNVQKRLDIPIAPKEGKRKLVLHFDVRNTVLVADSVTNVNVEQALNSFLTGVTWGKEVGGQWQWFCDEPSLRPPSSDVITYYKHLEQRLVKVPSDRALLRQVTGDFTQESIGQRFNLHFQDHLQFLRWPFTEVHDKTLTMEGGDGSLYHYILPAFFKLIHHLQAEGRDFCIIIRTYGLDAPNVLACTQHTLEGNHPQFPEALPIKLNNSPGKVYRTKSGKICFEKYLPEDSQGRIPRETYTDEQEIYDMLSNQTGVSAFVDDFIHWQDNNYHHTAGKPVWINPEDRSVQHIIFDDNIRITDIDSIVDLRIMDSQKGTSRSLSLEETVSFDNMCLVQADLLQSTRCVDYFVDKLSLCEENYEKFLSANS